MKFINSLQSEWLKTKRSAASWLGLIGGFFIPTIYLIAMLVEKQTINQGIVPGNVWMRHFSLLWNSMAMFLLPMGVILASSLITQIEFKNNTWKQVHASPQSYSRIFWAKITVILLMTVKFFVFFNIGIIVSGFLPCVIIGGELPKDGLPIMDFLRGNLYFFITCLPVIAIQYLISLQFKNFLVSVGSGLVMLIGTIIGINWKHIGLSPYSYSLRLAMRGEQEMSFYLQAIAFFGALTLVSYLFYYLKKDKS